jgi:hypothetical protein
MVRNEVEAAKHEAEFAKRQAETAGNEADMAGLAYAASTLAAAEDLANALKTSLNIATDCLRLSMHFFHPIQQCAQQVYHTALPLSPTSSQLRRSYRRSVADNRLFGVIVSGAPNAWGLLLRTIDVRPSQLTCIATSVKGIIAACEDTVNIYDAVTFALRQSLHVPGAVTKIQASNDGSILFFAHSHSVTMWDVQTGGLVHTFTTQSRINDIAVSTTEDHIACGSSDGSVKFWNTHTKEAGEGFRNNQPIVAICWLSPRKLAVSTQRTVYVRDIATGKTLASSSTPGRVWGMVLSPLGRDELLVGTLQPGEGVGQEVYSLGVAGHLQGKVVLNQLPWTHPGPLLRPTYIGQEIACITPPSGLQLFDTRSYNWTNNPPLLDAAISVAISLNRNLVAQTKDSIQIFSLDVLRSGETRSNVLTSHVYPLDKNHVICLLQPSRHLTILKLGTLRELLPGTDRVPSVRASLLRGFLAEFGVSAVVGMWRSGNPLPEWVEAVDEPLGVLSPSGTWIITFYGSPRWELCLKDARDGTTVGNLPLGRNGLGMWNVSDVAFDSETRFRLRMDKPGQHVQVLHDIIPSPSGRYSHTITQGKRVPLSKLQAIPPYTLDANCEWVVDAGLRKVCWISPGDVRRGNGGHFWAGTSLVMVGDDGVVRKLSFTEPDYRDIHNTYVR